MQRKKNDVGTRQLYASIREDLYLAAKRRATELRISLREFIEDALEGALFTQESADNEPSSIWNDEYLRMQLLQPVGSPVVLTKEEAERLVASRFVR